MVSWNLSIWPLGVWQSLSVHGIGLVSATDWATQLAFGRIIIKLYLLTDLLRRLECSTCFHDLYCTVTVILQKLTKSALKSKDFERKISQIFQWNVPKLHSWYDYFHKPYPYIPTVCETTRCTPGKQIQTDRPWSTYLLVPTYVGL